MIYSNNLNDSLTKFDNNLNNAILYTTNITALGNNNYQQSYNIAKAGTYLILTRIRCFGGTPTLPTNLGCKEMDNPTSDDLAGATYLTHYCWIVLPMVEYLTVGTHTRQFYVGSTFVNFEARTSLKYLA